MGSTLGNRHWILNSNVAPFNKYFNSILDDHLFVNRSNVNQMFTYFHTPYIFHNI